MLVLLDTALFFAIACAFAAIVLGRNLTRSIVAACGCLGALGLALVVAGGGYLGIVVVIVAALSLAIVEVFGWMLVDVDRDHLPPTDRPTWIARSLAFLLFGGGLVLMVLVAVERGELVLETPSATVLEASAIGSALYGRLYDATILLGLAIAASLVASLMLLRDDGEGK